MSDSTLALLLEFDDQYRRDQQQSADFLHRRDRRLALKHDAAGTCWPLSAWLATVRDRPVPPPHRDPRLRGWRRLRAVFVLAGAVLGMVTMLGLLYYQGGQRINVTLIVAVALLQWLLALLTSGQALIGWRPWRSLFQAGRPRWWPGGEPAPMLRALQPVLTARVAHSGGLAFAVAALLTLLTQVLIHDLAFGWSTTLQTSAPAYQGLMRALAWPWRDWLPGAVPSLHLVEQSRYFRMTGGTVTNPAMLGNWWPFLTMLWLSYVLLPRLILLALSRAHLNRRARRLLQDHPGRKALLERFTTPWLESGGNSGDDQAPARTTPSDRPLPAANGRVLIRWAGAGREQPGLAARFPGGGAPTLDAGGTASLDQDHAVLDQTARTGGPVVLATRGWEPPTGDLSDFLQDARHRLGTRVAIYLLPLADNDEPAAAGGELLAQWHRFIARQQDPMLILAGVPKPETAS